jgi:hypothetical protein
MDPCGSGFATLFTHTYRVVKTFICLSDSGEHASTVRGWVHSQTIAVSSPFVFSLYFYRNELPCPSCSQIEFWNWTTKIDFDFCIRQENIQCKFEAEELAAKQNYESEKQLSWDNVKVQLLNS